MTAWIYESHIDEEHKDETFFEGTVSFEELIEILEGYAPLDVELIGHGEDHACWETRSLYVDRDVTVIISLDWEGPPLSDEEWQRLGVEARRLRLLTLGVPESFAYLVEYLLADEA